MNELQIIKILSSNLESLLQMDCNFTMDYLLHNRDLQEPCFNK